MASLPCLRSQLAADGLKLRTGFSPIDLTCHDCSHPSLWGWGVEGWEGRGLGGVVTLGQFQLFKRTHTDSSASLFFSNPFHIWTMKIWKRENCIKRNWSPHGWQQGWGGSATLIEWVYTKLNVWTSLCRTTFQTVISMIVWCVLILKKQRIQSRMVLSRAHTTLQGPTIPFNLIKSHQIAHRYQSYMANIFCIKIHELFPGKE